MEQSQSSASNDKVMAALSAIPLVGIIVFFAMKDASPYVKNYARQGGVLFIFSLLAIIPPVALCVGPIELVAVVILLIKALQGDETFELPVVGDLGKQIFK